MEQEGVQVAIVRGWACPRCTLHNAAEVCQACGLRRRPNPPNRRTASSTSSSRLPSEGIGSLALRAAIAGAAGLALGRASSRSNFERAAFTALALAAVPAASFLVNSLLGRASGGGGSAPAPRPGAGREQRRRQLLRAAQHATEGAAAAGAITAEDQQLLQMVMQPAASRTERVRTIARVLEWLQQLEADPMPRSRSMQLVSALVVYELNTLVDEMDYEELHQAFGGGHPPVKGLEEDQIAALPAVELTAEAVAGLHSATCPVCLEGFEARERARLLPGCRHAFHANCLDPWLLNKAVCPVCRAAVEPAALEAPAQANAGGMEAAAAGAEFQAASAGT